MMWLDCETAIDGGAKVADKTRSSLYEVEGMYCWSKNFNDKCITSRADSFRTSNVVDHGKSDQHVYAMNLLKKENAQK